MTLVILFIIFGFLQSAVLAISQKRQFLSLVSVINIIFFLGYVFRPLLIIYYFDGYTYKGLNVIEDPYTLTIILAIANYCYLFLNIFMGKEDFIISEVFHFYLSLEFLAIYL